MNARAIFLFATLALVVALTLCLVNLRLAESGQVDFSNAMLNALIASIAFCSACLPVSITRAIR